MTVTHFSTAILLVLLLTACNTQTGDTGGGTASSSTSSAIAMWQPDPADPRPVLTEELLIQVNEAITTGGEREAWVQEHAEGQEEPSMQVGYVNDDRGIRMQVPFNPQWSNEKYVVPPTYDYPLMNIMQFGPLEVGEGEGGGLGRKYLMLFIPPRTAEEAMKDLASRPLPAEVVRKEPQIIYLASITVVESANSGLCDAHPNVEVIGKKFNYVLSYCVVGDEDITDDFAFLESIARTMQFSE